MLPPTGGCALPAMHVEPRRGPDKCPLLTTHSSAGWPVASLHALLAFSRTPSRSAPATASPCGRSEAGRSLARDERSQPSALPTSEHGLSLSSALSSQLDAILLQKEEGRPCLYGMRCAGVAVMLPWQIKVLFSYGTMCFVHVSMSHGLGEHSPLSLPSPSKASSWLLEPNKTGLDLNPHTS